MRITSSSHTERLSGETAKTGETGNNKVSVDHIVTERTD